MKKDDLVDAIGEVADRHIESSQSPKVIRRGAKRRPVVRALAAALAVAVGIGAFAAWRHSRPVEEMQDGGMSIPDGVLRLAKPVYPQRVRYSRKTFDEWWTQRRELRLNDVEIDAFRHYLETSIPVFLGGGDGENAVCSPIDVFVGLAMLAEAAGGETQRQLLDLLGQDSVEDVRELTNRAWNALYVNDGVSYLELASSVWLRDDMSFNTAVLDTLASDYYASAYSGKMGSAELNTALRDWLNVHTGGTLTEYAGGAELSGDTAMALVSTVYYKDKWYFNESLTDTGKFHSPAGDVDADFMHQTIEGGTYYWGDKYGAVIKYFENSQMFLILPDEGVTPEELLSDPQALELLCGHVNNKRSGQYEIELALPRFDIQSDGLLNSALKKLGVTDAFEMDAADFSPLCPEGGSMDPLYLSQVLHGTRVKVDEEGCEGAAYAVFDLAPGESGPPPEGEKIALTFDRPFLFAVTQDGLPVFAGIVNRP